MVMIIYIYTTIIRKVGFSLILIFLVRDVTIYLNVGGYSPTQYSDYELLDYAINVLGWVKDPKGGR